MKTRTHQKKWSLGGLLPAIAIAGMLILAGCATQQRSPYYGNSGNAGYGTSYGNNGSGVCNQCGTVQSVRQVYVKENNSHILGTVIGAVAGGLLGSTIGSGDGKKAATAAGAVAGGVVGNQVAKRGDNGSTPAWQVVVRLDNGQYATVTQRQNPSVQRGDRVQVRNDHVYAL